MFDDIQNQFREAVAQENAKNGDSFFKTIRETLNEREQPQNSTPPSYAPTSANGGEIWPTNDSGHFWYPDMTVPLSNYDNYILPDVATYTYRDGDEFAKILVELGLSDGSNLWGPGGDVEYYSKQLQDQGIDTSKNIPVGTTFELSPRWADDIYNDRLRRGIKPFIPSNGLFDNLDSWLEGLFEGAEALRLEDAKKRARRWTDVWRNQPGPIPNLNPGVLRENPKRNSNR